MALGMSWEGAPTSKPRIDEGVMSSDGDGTNEQVSPTMSKRKKNSHGQIGVASEVYHCAKASKRRARRINTRAASGNPSQEMQQTNPESPEVDSPQVESTPPLPPYPTPPLSSPPTFEETQTPPPSTPLSDNTSSPTRGPPRHSSRGSKSSRRLASATRKKVTKVTYGGVRSRKKKDVKISAAGAVGILLHAIEEESRARSDGMDKLEAKLAEKFAETETKLTEKLAETEAKVNEKLAGTEAKVTEKLAETEAKLGEETERREAGEKMLAEKDVMIERLRAQVPKPDEPKAWTEQVKGLIKYGGIRGVFMLSQTPRRNVERWIWAKVEECAAELGLRW